MHTLRILRYNGSLVTWTVVSSTTAKFKPPHGPTENIASHDLSIVAWCSYPCGLHRKHGSQLYSHWLRGVAWRVSLLLRALLCHCLTTCLGFQQICHNNKLGLREIGWGDKYWINLGPGRDQWRAVVNVVMNLRVPYNVGKFFSNWAIGGFSRRIHIHEISLV
jgi:hypothetical protein